LESWYHDVETKKWNKPSEVNPLPIESEMERLRRDIYRPDIEKLKLFTQMLQVNALYKKAKVVHKIVNHGHT
jgi:hypothetical protein